MDIQMTMQSPVDSRVPPQDLEYFFALALDLWCIADSDGYFLKLNKMWETTLGYTVDELIGRSYFDFIHPDDIAPTREVAAKLSDEQTPVLNFINRYRCKDGSYRYLEWRSQPQGTLIYAVARDVTERLRLEAYQARYAAIVATMNEGIVVQNRDGSIQMCNAAAERILGLTVAQMVGRTSVDPRWQAIHEDNTPFPGETHPAMVALRTGQPSLNVVMGIHKPDDTLTWILVNAQPIFQPNDPNPVSVITSFTDITKARQHAVELELQHQRVRLLSDFITNTSHELRTPLSIISVTAETLVILDDRAKRQERVTRILGQIKHLTQIIEQLQEMARLDQTIALEVTPLNLNDLVEALCQRYTYEHPELRFIVDLAPQLPPILGHAHYVNFSVSELLDNALRFAPPNTPIMLRTAANAEEVWLEVEDYGEGIPAEHLSHIFEHFYKVDSARVSHENRTGMGLAFVKRVMALHYGRVTVESQPHERTVFRLRFPVHDIDSLS